MRQALIVLALLALCLVGCEKKQELDPEITVTTVEPIIYGSRDELTEVLHQPDPCPPCPDTVRLWMRVDSTKFLDSGTEIHFSSPDTVMPPGQWGYLLSPMSIWPNGELRLWHPMNIDSVQSPYFRTRMKGRLFLIYVDEILEWPYPDSVFILKSAQGEDLRYD